MFKGVYTALITPFLKNRKVDYVSLINLLKFQEQSNVSGVVLLGTTAEECTLTHDECLQIIKTAINILKTKQIVVGVSGNCTQNIINKLKDYEQFNLDGYLVGTPYYNKPTPNGLVEHFSQISKTTTKPIILYNIPGRCGIKLDFDTLKKLQKYNNIVAIKEASGDIDYFTKLIATFGHRYDILCGNDNIFLPMLASGAIGCISVVSNVLPSLPVKIYENYEQNLKKCIFLHNKFTYFVNLLFAETNPICIKYLLSKYGFCNNILRSPMSKVTLKTKMQLDNLSKSIFEF